MDKEIVIVEAPGWLSLLSVRLLVSTGVMISQFMGLSPVSGSALIAWSLLDILSLSFCPSPACAHLFSCSLTLSLKKINKLKKQEIMITYSAEYYLTIKKNGILPSVTAWMDLEVILLSEVETEKDKYHMISLNVESILKKINFKKSSWIQRID